MKYFGIADAFGLDSFVPWASMVALSALNRDKTLNSTMNMMSLRAYANRHRHAVVYKVDLPEKDAKVIDALYNAGESEKALKLMKRAAITVEIARGPGNKKSWNMIPNRDLDPFSE